MKVRISILSLILILAAVTGCAALQQKPPTALEQKIYDITTNVVERTNIVQQTNYQTVTVPVPVNVTNLVTHEVTQTNVINVPMVVTQTNVVDSTNYVFAVSDKTKGEIATGTAVATAMAGPYGTVAGIVAAGVLGLWGSLRSKRANVLEAVSANSTQVIETARNVIRALPNGGQVGTQFDNWMMGHQSAAGVANAVAAIVDDAVDPSHATHAASDILSAVEVPITPKAAAPAQPAAPKAAV